MFWAGDFWERNPDTTNDYAADGWGRYFINAPFRIMSINIKLPSLEYENHPYLKTPLFKGATYSFQVTVTWLEDVYRTVQKMHLDWLTRWYNRQYDVLRCGPQGKFKSLDVYAFHYVNTSGKLLEAPTIEVLFRIKLRGLMPKDIGELKFDYSNPGNESPVTCTYACAKSLWEYNPAFYKSNYKNVWGSTFMSSTDLSTVWNPTGSDGKGSIPSSGDLTNQTEAIKTLATITPFIAGEGEIT
jgi:hypothetical protein